MYYDITFNERKLRKIDSKCKLTYEQVGPILGIDREHFQEKDNWYKIDAVMQYFKQRGDSRVVGELLSGRILSMHGFETASYEVVMLGDKVGMISPNVHKEGYRYESLATLHRLYPNFSNLYYTDTKRVTLKKIIELLKINVPNSEEVIYQLIRKYVMDWFTNQLDDNVRNLTFELDPEGHLQLAKIIDSESSFGATKKGINTEMNEIWIPAIPYQDELFKTMPTKEDGMDVNIVYLMLDYPEIVMPLLEQLIDTNYDVLIELFRKSPYDSKFYLPDGGVDFLKAFVNSRQDEAYRMHNL